MTKISKPSSNSKFPLKEKQCIPTSKSCTHQRDYPTLNKFLKGDPGNIRELENLLATCQEKNLKLSDQVILSFSLSKHPRMKQIFALKEVHETFYQLMWHPFEIDRALQRMIMNYRFEDGIDAHFCSQLLIIEQLRAMFLIVGENLGDVDMEELDPMIESKN